jgi:tRNA (guanine37-N1)-methyltransferase
MRTGVIGRGVAKEVLEVESVNLRQFAVDKHGSVDDTPYGGGPGMVMRPEPLVEAVESIQRSGKSRVIMMTPSGTPFTQSKAQELSSLDHLIFICGRYEGMDERVKTCLEPEEISLGDFILSGGELAALSIADATGRLIPGVLGDFDSTKEESFCQQGLEYPQYTRPRVFRDHEVPEVLLSGHHGAIRDWREGQSQRLTQLRRPDLAQKLDAVS